MNDPLFAVMVTILGACLFPLGLSIAVGWRESRQRRQASSHPAE